MTGELQVHRGGQGERVLLLLHGLGATGDIWNAWRPVLSERWPGQWIAPDLPGHGASPAMASYTFDGLAAEVARVVPPGAPTVVFGHSLGGVVGLALAGERPGIAVTGVIGLGIKTAWSEDELRRAQALADRPIAWYATRDEAAARHLRVAGLAHLVKPTDPMVDAGLRELDGRWRLAMDARAFGVGAPDMAGLLAACRTEILLARGDGDPMNSDAELAQLDAATFTLAGLGHNAHVESPERCFALLDRLTSVNLG